MSLDTASAHAAMQQLLNPTRRIIPAMTNPLDVCTVISIIPKYIKEVKHTIFPGEFILEPGTYNDPSLLVVTSSSWWREIDEDQPLLEIPQSSIMVADSIVKDYCNSYLGTNGEACRPGMFYIPGALTVTELKGKHQHRLDAAKMYQDNWFRALVKLADSLWARSNSNPLAVSDDMRLAAKELGLQETKDWMRDFKMIDMTRCPACGTLANPEYPVCGNCKAIINKQRAEELGLTFVKVG